MTLKELRFEEIGFRCLVWDDRGRNSYGKFAVVRGVRPREMLVRLDMNQYGPFRS